MRASSIIVEGTLLTITGYDGEQLYPEANGICLYTEDQESNEEYVFYYYEIMEMIECESVQFLQLIRLR